MFTQFDFFAFFHVSSVCRFIENHIDIAILCHFYFLTLEKSDCSIFALVHHIHPIYLIHLIHLVHLF